MTRLWDVVLIPVAIHVCMSMAEHIISLPLCKVQGWRDGRGGCVWLAGWPVAGCDAHVWHNLRQKEIGLITGVKKGRRGPGGGREKTRR